MSFIACLDSVPIFLGIFDFSVAPQLLYYAYVPIIILSLFFGTFVFIKDNFSLKSKYLFLISILFSLWVLNIIFQWIIVYANLSLFSWKITAIIEVFIPVFVLYFYYSFVYNVDNLPKYIRWLVYFVVIGTTVLLETKYNMSAFDVVACEAQVGPLLYILAGFEILSAFIILFDSVFFIKNRPIFFDKKSQAILLAFSSAMFLIVFALSNLIGFITQIYQINLVGPLGLIIFLAYLTFIIVKFRAFNIKLLASRALIITIFVIVTSQFLFIKTPINRVLNGVNLIIVVCIGYYLDKSIKKIDERNEEIIRQNKMIIKQKEDLELANQNQVNLIHFITHQIKGFFTRSRDVFSLLLDGDYGELSGEAKGLVKQGFDSDTKGVEMVEDVLNAANVKKGTVKYEFGQFDIEKMISAVISDAKKLADERGLNLEFVKTEGVDYTYNGDEKQLNQVIKNLIDNAIKYTKSGGVKVYITKDKGKFMMFVKDTGMGISQDDMKILFTQGGRSKRSLEVNVDSTGYGLYIAKAIVEAHKGRIWAESEGEGEGSTFYVELG